MWTGMMLLGLLAAFSLPDMSDTDDEDEAAAEDEDGFFGDEGADPLAGLSEDLGPEFSTGSFVAGGAPGVTVLLDFQEGSDELELRMPGDVSEVTMQDAGDDGPAAISYVSADEVTEVQFAGLETVPTADISVTVDGAEPVPLDLFLNEAEEDVEPDDAEGGVPPEDGEVPSVPADSGTGAGGLQPGDGEAPTIPDDSGDGDAGLLPEDGEAPTVPNASGGGGLVLQPEDGEAPTIPDDSGDTDVGLQPEDGEAPTVPDDSGDGDAALQPEDGAEPTVPSGSAALQPEDGEAPTVPDDSGDGDVGLQPEDGATQTSVPDPGGADSVTEVAAGETVSATDDEDAFWYDAESDDSAPARIEDFEPGEDVLYITLEPGTGGDVEVRAAEDAGETLVQIGGHTVAVLAGTTDASLEDIYVDERLALSA